MEKPPVPTTPEVVLEEYNSPLKSPLNHSLMEIFKELKFGRTAAEQIYLNRLIAELDSATD